MDGIHRKVFYLSLDMHLSMNTVHTEDVTMHGSTGLKKGARSSNELQRFCKHAVPARLTLNFLRKFGCIYIIIVSIGVLKSM